MLFNKDEDHKGTDELKKLTGFLYASINFDNIKTDIQLQEEEMISLIGQDVYDRAQNYYDSGDFNPDGSELNDKLVQHIQLPIAYYAIHAYQAHTDVSHTGDGRKVNIDSEHEKMPWEWMIHRDDEATLNKAHKTTDRLIAFLEKNEDDISEWKNSDAQKAARSLFINTAEQFDAIFPIDKSRRFFLKIIPFIKEAERKHLKPVLGDTFDDIKAAIKSNDFEDYEDTLGYIRVPLALFSLSIAIKRLSIQILPNGIFQEYVSERMTQKAKNVADTSVRKEIGHALFQDAQLELKSLMEYLNKLEAEASGEDFTIPDMTSHINSNENIVRL